MVCVQKGRRADIQQDVSFNSDFVDDLIIKAGKDCRTVFMQIRLVVNHSLEVKLMQKDKNRSNSLFFLALVSFFHVLQESDFSCLRFDSCSRCVDSGHEQTNDAYD